jgi:predicted patatin/cPLA2 family phospholipase
MTSKLLFTFSISFLSLTFVSTNLSAMEVPGRPALSNRYPLPEEVLNGKRQLRVLSIDGGGTRGVIVLEQLKQLERWLKVDRLSKVFDVITGTSTGGIIALGIAKGMTSTEISAIYLEHARKIFQNPGMLHKVTNLGGYFGAAYSTEGIDATILQHFGDSTLTELERPVMIMAAEQTPLGPQPVFLDNLEGADYLVADLSRATSAAPTYFPPHRIGKRTFVDGGVVCNNPSQQAFLRLIEVYPELDRGPKSNIFIASFGTGYYEGGEINKSHMPGEVALDLITGSMHAASELAVKTLKYCLNRHAQTDEELCFFRMNVKLPGKIELDDTGVNLLEVTMLALGLDRTKDRDVIEHCESFRCLYESLRRQQEAEIALHTAEQEAAILEHAEQTADDKESEHLVFLRKVRMYYKARALGRNAVTDPGDLENGHRVAALGEAIFVGSIPTVLAILRLELRDNEAKSEFIQKLWDIPFAFYLETLRRNKRTSAVVVAASDSTDPVASAVQLAALLADETQYKNALSSMYRDLEAFDDVAQMAKLRYWLNRYAVVVDLRRSTNSKSPRHAFHTALMLGDIRRAYEILTKSEFAKSFEKVALLQFLSREINRDGNRVLSAELKSLVSK